MNLGYYASNPKNCPKFSDYSKTHKYVYSSSENKHPTPAGEDCILAILGVYG